MKHHKMFCIDYELTKRLKDINASELVNELLTSHFKRKNLKDLSIPELERKLAIQERKEVIKKELKELDNE